MISFVTKRLFVVHDSVEDFCTLDYIRDLDVKPNTVIEIGGGDFHWTVGGHNTRQELYVTAYGDNTKYFHYDYSDPDRQTYEKLLGNIIDDLRNGLYVMIVTYDSTPNFGSKFLLDMIGTAFGEFRDKKYKLFIHRI